MTLDPYTPPNTLNRSYPNQHTNSPSNLRGPLIYCAVSGLIGAIVAIPLLVAIPRTANPNPIGYLIVLLSIPIGAIVFRIRARNWPIDDSVRRKQYLFSLSVLVFPLLVTAIVGLRGQGIGFVAIGVTVSLILIFSIFATGLRRPRQCDP